MTSPALSALERGSTMTEVPRARRRMTREEDFTWWASRARHPDQQSAHAHGWHARDGEIDELRAALKQSVEALAESLDNIVWMSGAEDFSPGKQAATHWQSIREQLTGWIEALAAARALLEQGQ